VCKQSKRLAWGFFAHQWFNRPEICLPEQMQVCKPGMAIDQKAWEQSQKPLAVCHHDHP
jgi:hypothetical protein